MLKRSSIHSLLLASLLCSTHVYGTDIPDIALSEEQFSHLRSFATQHPEIELDLQGNQNLAEIQAAVVQKIALNADLKEKFFISFYNKFIRRNSSSENQETALNPDPGNNYLSSLIHKAIKRDNAAEQDSYIINPFNSILLGIIGTPYERAFLSEIERALSEKYRREFMGLIGERFGKNHEIFKRYCAAAIKHGDKNTDYFAALIGTPHEAAITPQIEAMIADSSYRPYFIAGLSITLGRDHDTYRRLCAAAIKYGDLNPLYFANLIGTPHEEAIMSQLEAAMTDQRFRDDFMLWTNSRLDEGNEAYQRCSVIAIKCGDKNPCYFAALIGTPHEASIASRLEEAMADENFRYNILQWMPEHHELKYAAFLRYCAIAIKYGDRTPPYFAALIRTPHEEVTTPYLEALMADAHFREKFISKLADRLGFEHPTVQHYIHMALGFDNADNPNSFLAVHQEMLRKSEDVVQHNMTQLTPGLQHKRAVIQEARKDKSVHMPLNVWHHLFDQLQKVVHHTQGAFSHLMGDVNITDLLALRENQQIASLLDPKDSLVANTKVSAHSQMLREVLQNIRGVDATQLREEGEFGANLSVFLQLLVNIQTCPTGKLNGIAHSYIYMNQGRVLDESLLGTDGFKREIVDYFKEELRRKREATLTLMLKNGLRLPNADPHDVYYIRGIIGSEVGLLLENETPLIDINANAVSSAVRELSKQQLLDLFYQYYKVEDVVSIVHEMLNNNTIQVSAGQKNLTLRIINEFLQGEAFDPDADLYKSKYVVTNAKGEPTGLTLEAAKALLAMLGIVEMN